jgi:hypothetical protein
VSEPSEAVFVAQDGAWLPTAHARGPWSAQECHGGAPTALIVRELERLEPGGEMVLTRLTFGFLAGVPLAPLAIEAHVAKPGKRVQLLDARLMAGGREVLRARATRIRRGNALDASPVGERRMPPPDAGSVLASFEGVPQEAFHPSAVEIRVVGGERGSGAAQAWFRLRRSLVDEEEPSPLQRAVAAADFGNGISHVLPFGEWLFVNTDLTVQLHREPVGEWIGLDARTDVSRAGVGAALSILHDELGRFGAAAQSLYVERRCGESPP